MKTVLLVEDNDMNARLIKFVLERDGFAVLLSATGEEGIRIATETAPDIILMDVHLPGMDGLEAAHRLKQADATSRIPVIALTANVMEGDKERVIAAGCDGYIAKPVNTRELAGAITGYLNAG